MLVLQTMKEEHRTTYELMVNKVSVRKVKKFLCFTEGFSLTAREQKREFISLNFDALSVRVKLTAEGGRSCCKAHVDRRRRARMRLSTTKEPTQPRSSEATNSGTNTSGRKVGRPKCRKSRTAEIWRENGVGFFDFWHIKIRHHAESGVGGGISGRFRG